MRDVDLAEAMGYTLSIDSYREYAPFVESAMRTAEVNSVKRAAAFLSQIGHESVGLLYMQELGDDDYFRQYDNRSDLGNGPGDGPRFHGRGPIQLTGRNNYQSFGFWCQGKGLIDDPYLFVNCPDLVAEKEWGFQAAAYYWVTRTELNVAADNEDIDRVSVIVNGGWNGIDDRRARYYRCMNMGDRILPGGTSSPMSYEIPYDRGNVVQDTYYNCGPASTQTVVLAATGTLFAEWDLGNRLGTTENGTDYIGQFPPVLNELIPGGDYRIRNVTDYPDGNLKNVMWDEITGSINANHGVVINIDAPPSNYPRGVYGSISPSYGGGEVFHYIAAMGYRDGEEGRALWIADSGFYPYGYWISFDQICSLVVPKGYAYSTAPAAEGRGGNGEEILMGMDQIMAIDETKRGVQLLVQQQDILLSLVHMILDQFAGPERDENGWNKWTGWNGNNDWPGTQGVATVQNIITRLDELKKSLDELKQEVTLTDFKKAVDINRKLDWKTRRGIYFVVALVGLVFAVLGKATAEQVDSFNNTLLGLLGDGSTVAMIVSGLFAAYNTNARSDSAHTSREAELEATAQRAAEHAINSTIDVPEHFSGDIADAYRASGEGKHAL